MRVSFEEYVKAWRERDKETEERRERLRQSAKSDAARLAEYLSHQPAVTRVYLFGSALDADRFKEESDIDLAVEGLVPELFFKAWAALEELTHFRVDLVPLEDCSKAMRENILGKGELLYEHG